MTNFVIYDTGNTAEPGRVHQSNKVFETEGYADVLNEHGLRFVALDSENYIPPHGIMIDKGEVVERKPMPIVVDRTKIKAGGTEAAVFTGIPKGAKVSVFLGSLLLGSDTVPTGSIDLPIPVPCTYQVRAELWPWLEFNVSVEAY